MDTLTLCGVDIEYDPLSDFPKIWFYLDHLRDALGRDSNWITSLKKRTLNVLDISEPKYHSNGAGHAVSCIEYESLRTLLAEKARASLTVQQKELLEQARTEFSLWDAFITPLDLTLSGHELTEVADLHRPQLSSTLFHAHSVAKALGKRTKWLSKRLTKLPDSEKFQDKKPWSESDRKSWFITRRGLGLLLADSNAFGGDLTLLRARQDLQQQLQQKAGEQLSAKLAAAATDKERGILRRDFERCRLNQQINMLAGDVDVSLSPRLLASGARYLQFSYIPSSSVQAAQQELWEGPMMNLLSSLMETYRDQLTVRGLQGRTRILSIPASLIGQELADGSRIDYNFLCRFGQVGRTSVAKAVAYAAAFRPGGCPPAPVTLHRERYKLGVSVATLTDEAGEQWYLPEFSRPSAFQTVNVKTDSGTKQAVTKQYLKQTKEAVWRVYREKKLAAGQVALSRTKFLSTCGQEFSSMRDAFCQCNGCMDGSNCIKKMKEPIALIPVDEGKAAERAQLLVDIETFKKEIHDVRRSIAGHFNHPDADAKSGVAHDPVHTDTVKCPRCAVNLGFLAKLTSLVTSKLRGKPKKEALEVVTGIRSYEAHVRRAAIQHAQFQLSLSSLDTETCVVVLDYKEKLKWRLTKNERQQDFFENKQVSCLGCVVFTAIPSEEQLPNGPVLKRHVHNFLSQDTTQDGEWTNGALDLLLDTLSQTFKRIVVWSDNGIHFHSSLVINRLPALCDRFRVTIEWNFTEPGEGKSSADQHFGHQAGHLENYICTEADIDGPDDLVSVIGTMAAVTASLYNPNRLIAAHEVPSIKGISVFHQFTVSESGDLLARKLTNIGDSVTLPPAGIKLKPAALFKKACISKSEAAQRVFTRFPDIAADYRSLLINASDGNPVNAQTTKLNKSHEDYEDVVQRLSLASQASEYAVCQGIEDQGKKTPHTLFEMLLQCEAFLVCLEKDRQEERKRVRARHSDNNSSNSNSNSDSESKNNAVPLFTLEDFQPSHRKLDAAKLAPKPPKTLAESTVQRKQREAERSAEQAKRANAYYEHTGQLHLMVDDSPEGERVRMSDAKAAGSRASVYMQDDDDPASELGQEQVHSGEHKMDMSADSKSVPPALGIESKRSTHNRSNADAETVSPNAPGLGLFSGSAHSRSDLSNPGADTSSSSSSFSAAFR